MPDLPRYHIETPERVDGMQLQAADDGPYCLWADVSARLQQLEAERDEARAAFATEHAIHRQEQDNYSASWEHERALRNSGDDALDLALTAISQLAKEKESLQASLDQLHGAKFSDRVYHALKSRAETAEAALAETRDALQHARALLKRIGATSDGSYWWKEISDVLARMDTPGASDALVPQPPSEPSSTPSPVKDEEL